MNKIIFRITEKGTENIEGWTESPNCYTPSEINDIKDPSGGSSLYKITSIPSPFANMAIVVDALNKFKDKRFPIDGKTIYHKTISDMLDVAQAFFNKDFLSNKHKVKIIRWNRKTEMERLKKASKEHYLIAKTLELYLTQDEKAYNFHLLEDLYILKIDNVIVGGTSPATLFFPSPNNLQKQGLRDISFGKDTLFDDDYCQIYEREEQFIKSFYALYKKYRILHELGSTRLLWNYLERCLEEKIKNFNNNLYSEIYDYNENSFGDLFDYLCGENENDYVKPIKDVYLPKQRIESQDSKIRNSDFIIQPSRKVDVTKTKLPLVLPVERFNDSLMYVEDVWDPEKITVPYKAPISDTSKRILPGTTHLYPYLTIDDFLEPYLISLPYPINKESYLDGNLVSKSSDNKVSYLIPLKSTFFEYFTIDDLNRTLKNDKKMFEIKEGVGESVEVHLKIPIQKDKIIAYMRTYHKDIEPNISEKENKGAIISVKVNLAIYPGFKLSNGEYRVQLIDADKRYRQKIKAYFYKETTETVEPIYEICHTEKGKSENQFAGITYYILNHEKDFDYVKIHLIENNASGIVIPKWRSAEGGEEKIYFSVDFGTTNTHIEYKEGKNANIKSLTYQEIVECSLILMAKDFSDKLELSDQYLAQNLHFFLSNQSKETKEYHFPARTVIQKSPAITESKQMQALSGFNIAWMYHTQKHKYGGEGYKTNLKWLDNNIENKQYREKFIEEIVIHIKSIAVKKNYSPDRINIIWFYPSVMTMNQRTELEEIWSKSIKRHLSKEVVSKSIPESFAPFYFYKYTNKIKSGSIKPAVSVDIGGGTTDINVFKGNQPILFSSFHFAGNIIFGSGYNTKPNSNLLTKYYSTELDKKISKEYLEIIKRTENNCTEFNNLLFALEKQNQDSEFNYSELLKNDPEFKIILLYYYTNIIYHIADLIKFNAINPPSEIFFSGTGSKSFNILTSSSTIREKYVSEIFRHFYPESKDPIKVILENEIPKEITAKGGLYIEDEELPDIKDIKKSYSGIESKEVLQWKEFKEEGIVEEYIKVMEKYHAFFEALHQKLDFQDLFGINQSIVARFMNAIKENIPYYGDFISTGYDYRSKIEELDENKFMDESAFFYIPVGIIQDWLNHRYRVDKNN